MQSYLIFGLSAALGSMGELAGHEKRGSLTWPTRSAIIGMMGAALGIRRDDDFSFLDCLQVAVAIFDRGYPLRDFHTFESVPRSKVKDPVSRPLALKQAGLNTKVSLTSRDYRQTPLFGIAVFGGDELGKIASALNEPHYTLYLGRKSCPLSAPPGARVVAAVSAEIALKSLILPPWYRPSVKAETLIFDDAEGEIVHDVPLDRKRWHFGERRVSQRQVEIVVEIA